MQLPFPALISPSLVSQVQCDDSSAPADPVQSQDLHLVRQTAVSLSLRTVSPRVYLLHTQLTDHLSDRTAFKNGWRNDTKLTRKTIRVCCEGFAQVEGRCLRESLLPLQVLFLPV